MKNLKVSIALKKYYKAHPKIKYGLRQTRFYDIFNNLQRRCNSKSNNRYAYYGGRGIKCLWKNFEEFKNDMYESYQKHCKDYGEHNTQIDRKNVDGNYCKENCRWVTLLEQAINKKNTIQIDFNKTKVSLRQWSKINGLNYKSVFYHFKYKKESLNKILNYFKNYA